MSAHGESSGSGGEGPTANAGPSSDVPATVIDDSSLPLDNSDDNSADSGDAGEPIPEPDLSERPLAVPYCANCGMRTLGTTSPISDVVKGRSSGHF